MRKLCPAFALAAALVSSVAAPLRAQDADGIAVLLRNVEQIIRTNNEPAFLAQFAASADRERTQAFAASELSSGVTRAVVQERDREPLRGAAPGDGYRVIADVFAEAGDRARAATWRLDLHRVGGAGATHEWAIAEGERLSFVENLYRLSLGTTTQYAARNLRIAAEDLDITLADGSVFVCEVDQGITGLVLLGRGAMSFHPEPATEKGQVKIFSGSETLESPFDTAFVRLNPNDFDRLVSASQLQPRAPGAVDPRELKRALDVFREESGKSFGVDLGDLSRDAWSLLPGPGDFLAEIRTRRFDTITYARAGSEAEDITVFDRKKHRNISIYASKQKLASRGRFYNEDELVDYDVIDYDIDVDATPDRSWIEGRARIYLKIRSDVVNTITLKLADSLVVRSIVSNELGRLFGIRVKGQNAIVVNLPASVLRDTTLTLNVTYAGRLEPQAPEREALALQRAVEADGPMFNAEPSYLYSSRSFWYPQAVVSDYATARIRLTIPPALDAVGSGELEPGFPVLVPAKDGTPPRKQYAFVASQPLRYLAFIISRFQRVETVSVGFPDAPPGTDDVVLPGLSYRSLSLSIETNPRQASRGRDMIDRATDIATFYQSLLGDVPYSSFTIALVESDLPGGHSPAYFASLNQPLLTSQLVWRNDPSSFNNFPEFFLAHEIAHQWWGQAVGWRNYHEQWISEGFAQYFAALYAEHARGDGAFAGVLRQLRRWGMDQSEQGPVYLGYRLGHIRGEGRVFRALVYNKSAAVLHMLRRLVGDEAFFSGVRRFYRTNRFTKAGTQEFRTAMEATTGMDLKRFFERWIYGSSLPRLKFGYVVDGTEVVLRVEQLSDEIFDLPLAVSLQYADRTTLEVVIPVTDRVVEKRVKLAAPLRGVEVDKDQGVLAEISKS